MAPPDMAALEEASLAVSLGSLRTVEQGAGTDKVVLIHGFGGDAENWRFNLDALAGSRKAVAIDLPGHGKATTNVGSGDVAQLVDAVAEACDALDARAPGPTHLVGHSLGGLVAAEVALRDPSRCASLALIAPAGFGQPVNRDYIAGFVSAQTESEMRPVLELLFANKAIVSSLLVGEVLAGKRRDGAQAALAAISERLLAPGEPHTVDGARLAASGVRTLVVWGAEDQVIACPGRASRLAGAPVEVLDGIGHSPHVEAAGAVNRALADFFDHCHVPTERSS